MNQSPGARDPELLDDPREIAGWTRVYAQNRTLGMVVFFAIFVLLCAAMGGGSCLAAMAYLKGNMLLLAEGIILSVSGLVATIYFSIPQWGGRRMEHLTRRLYAKEGNVAMTAPPTRGRRRAGMIAVSGLVVCLVTCVALGFLGYIPHNYMQPVSALYVVPFLVIQTILMRPAVGWGMLLWPILYGLHAILIVVGVPILFGEKWDFLNMLVPTVGYGMLVAILGHAYSRFALHKIMRLARTNPPTGNGPVEVPHP